MDMFWLNHEQLLKGVNLGFQRYLSRQVKWDRRLIGIFGAKGVGKTTLLLQRIKLAYGDSHEALYLPLDNIWFQERCMLSETVRQFYEEGGRHLFLDNVHRYGSWVQAIECLHDDYPDMQIVFAAPLLVEGEKTEMPFDGKGDWYTLHTMSFREYLSYEGALDLKPVPLDELLLNHAEVTQQVMDEVNIVPIFRNYLEHGCYPFYWEDPDAFNFRLQDLVRDSIDVDLPAIRQMNNAMFRKMKQLLIQLAQEAPEFPRMQALTSKYEADNTHIHRLLGYIKEIGVLRILQVRKEDGTLARSYRSFLANTNLMASLFREMERVYVGETFFVDQMDAFNFRLQDLVRDSIDVDLPAIRQMNNAMFRKMKQLLIQLAQEAPEFPRMQALTSKYEADNTHIHRLLGYIKEIGVLRILQVRKEDGTLARSYRSFLANTNLMASLFREMERVYVGETFFVDQMSNCGTVELLHNGDYRVNEKYTFMIGDPLMDYERIKNVENAFAAIHGQPKSVGNKIPVWALGLCY